MSFSEDSTKWNFKIAQRRLQKQLSTIKLRRAIRTTTHHSPVPSDDCSLSSSFTADDRQKCSECWHHMAMTLLHSPTPKRAPSSFRQARKTLEAALTIESIEEALLITTNE